MKMALIRFGILLCCGVTLWAPPSEGAPKETVIWSFGNGTDGQQPLSGLTQSPGLRNAFLGTTQGGGEYGEGTAYEINLKVDKVTVEASFGNGTNGTSPIAGLTFAPNYGIYGTTTYGGSRQDSGGTIFTLSNATQPIYSFQIPPDGNAPVGTMVYYNGSLYGTTDYGGKNNGGAVFAFNPGPQAESIVYNFCSSSGCSDGNDPEGGLMVYQGTLYGTTVGGGTYSDGTVYSLSPKTGAEAVLYSFQGGDDGANPQATLIPVDGAFWGTTQAGGGSNNDGTIFQVNPTTGIETVMYNFCQFTSCPDGATPAPGSLLRHGATLYGITSAGGSGNQGTVFAFDLKSLKETVVYSFCQMANCADGSNPEGFLVEYNHKLYGTTRCGGAYAEGTQGCGAYGEGTVFEISGIFD